jgi:hypothetical protein
MNCNDARPLLDLLVDGVLDAKDTALVLDHLKTCEQCHSEYSALESLRGRFNIMREQPQMMPSLMAKMSATLKDVEKAEQQKRVRQSARVAAKWMALAASVVVIGVLTVPQLQKAHEKQTSAQTASAATLIDDLANNANVQPVIDRSLLPAKLGYEPKYIKMSNWQMAKMNVYSAHAATTLARFDFVGTGSSAAQQMTCYQAPQGAIGATDAVSETVGSKRVLFGSHGKYHFALWSQNGRDYLLVGTQPKAMFEGIARDS